MVDTASPVWNLGKVCNLGRVCNSGRVCNLKNNPDGGVTHVDHLPR